MLKRISLLLAALTLYAGPAPARAGESETFAAARDFISALTDLDVSLQRLHDLTKADKVSGAEVGPLCATLRPDPNEPPDMPESIDDVLKRNAVSRGDANALCDALAAARAVGEQAKAANLRAAAACKTFRIPACDIANDVVAAQKDARARMETNGQR